VTPPKKAEVAAIQSLTRVARALKVRASEKRGELYTRSSDTSAEGDEVSWVFAQATVGK